MLAPLIAALATLSSAAPDADLSARFAIAAAPNVHFTVLPSVKAKPQGAQTPSCAKPEAGLCDINWGSAPQMFAPIPLPGAALSQLQPLLRAEDGTPLIFLRSTPSPEVLLAFDLDAETLAQPGARLRRWPYFNYLLHVAACQVTGTPPPRFAEWSHSPLPGPRTRLFAFFTVPALWLLVLGLYFLARRHGQRASDAGERFLSAVAAMRHPPAKASQAEPLRVLAFARPLSGLLTLLAGMLLLTGPYFAMQSIIARHVQPFPEADGFWRTTCDVLFIAWLTFDMGTQTAFVKYFAEHRVSKPEAALHDVQFYVWFQIFSRLLEASLLVAFALGYLAFSTLALYAPFVLLYAAACQPAFPAVGKFLCQAIQRFDYYNLLDFLESRLLAFLLPLPFALLGRAWGRAHPEFGESYGAALGMGTAGLFNALAVLGIGMYAMHRLGLPLLPLFLAQFRRETVKRQLWFGLRLTIGQEPFRLTQMLETLILARWLRDSPYWLGLRDLLHNRLTMIAYFSWGFYQSAVPAVSEALGAGKRRLVQYYIARYLQFGELFATMVFSLLCAVGPLYIERALGGQWIRAADYLIIAAASGLFLPWAWLTDALQQGAGRPGTTTAVMLIEQGARLSLLIVLVPRYQFLGMYMAMLSTLLLKIAVAWTINHRTIVPLRVPLWPALGTPICVGVCNFLCWRGAAMLWNPQSATAILALFFVAGAGSIGLCFFLTGLFGGFDQHARRELVQAGQLSAVLGPLCRGLAAFGDYGARLSPWQPAPPEAWQDAQREMGEIESSEPPQ